MNKIIAILTTALLIGACALPPQTNGKPVEYKDSPIHKAFVRIMQEQPTEPEGYCSEIKEFKELKIPCVVLYHIMELDSFYKMFTEKEPDDGIKSIINSEVFCFHGLTKHCLVLGL
jgi:hypothetical protein